MIKTILASGICQNLETKIQTASCQLQQLRFKVQKQKRMADPKAAKEKKAWFKKDQTKKNVLPEKDTRLLDNPMWLARVPKDDVWIRCHYPKPTYSLQDIIAMHRELLQPCILNSTDATLYADMELNLKTKKKTKFSGTVRSNLRLPHDFDHQLEHRILIFCKTQEEKEIALNHGAALAGGIELIEQMSNDEISRSDFNVVLSTPEMLAEVVHVRNIIGRDYFPSPKREGTVSADIEAMIENITKGIFFQSVKNTQSTAKLQAPFAKLDMPDEHIYNNLKTLFDAVVLFKSAANPGEYINTLLVIAPPSPEKLSLKLNTEEFRETKTKKKEKVSVVEEEEEQEEEEIQQAAESQS